MRIWEEITIRTSQMIEGLIKRIGDERKGLFENRCEVVLVMGGDILRAKKLISFFQRVYDDRVIGVLFQESRQGE